ncbi:MAG: excinuclease ABC subunit UvrC, partial [Chitinispirillaceae bacterium]|nr:excinuclease ABC subunit UvrC [Chitinispirillaceae bacterium]
SMVKHIADLNYLVTDTELEALILECNLIKKHKPKYNVLLKDDKHYPYLKVTVTESFPRLLVVRKVESDGSVYFGPYSDVTAMRRLVSFAKRIFLIRDCKHTLPTNKIKRPCINFSIKRCSAPCVGKISEEDYREQVNNLIKFFNGKRKDILKKLEEKMNDASNKLLFEEAAKYRDQILLIKDASRLQQVDLKLEDLDCDVFGIAESNSNICMTVLHFREGLLINSRHFLFQKKMWNSLDNSHDNLFLQFYLSRGEEPPPLILISANVGFSVEALQVWLNENFKKDSQIVLPVKGTRKLLVAMAEKNAYMFLLQNEHSEEKIALTDLQKILNLPEPPETIEAFDISNLGSSFAVAGMVRFTNGKPEKSSYRHYKIKTVEGQNDFGMMMEVVHRRLKRLAEEGKPFPDLILIDGGIAQLNSALEAVSSFENPPKVISLAKKEELIFTPYHSGPIALPQSNPARKLLERIRDEVHRFSVAFHRRIRDKQFSQSILEKVDGIGKKRAAALIKRFGSLQRLKEAEIEELIKVKGITKEIALKIKLL